MPLCLWVLVSVLQDTHKEEALMPEARDSIAIEVSCVKEMFSCHMCRVLHLGHS